MKREFLLENWQGGIDNRSRDNRVAENHVRDMLNLDPAPTLRARIGYEKVIPGTACRAIAAIDRVLLFVDGTSLIEYDLATDTQRTLATVAGAGPVAFTEHNEEMFISTARECLRYKDGVLRQWGVPTVRTQPSVSVTNARDGDRLYAMTYVNAYGEEGGTVSAGKVSDGDYVFTVSELPADHTAKIYVSAVNGRTLYYQTEVNATGNVPVTLPVTDTESLATMHMAEPSPSTHLASYNGVIAMASGKSLFGTSPLWPHLVDYQSSFFSYPEDIGLLLSGNSALYVSADKCYALSGVETDSPQQATMLDYPAFAGTGTILPNGNATWVTRYGVAIESGGGIEEPSKERFVAGNNESGATGVVEHDGAQRLVASLKRSESQGGLAATDYFEAEVIRP